MQVARWGNSLAIRIPSAMARRMNIAEGDEVELIDGPGKSLRLMTREDRLAILEALSDLGPPLPADWRFDRYEANAR